MARINLLPWREQQRKERETQFYIMLGLAAALVVGLLAYVHMRVATQVEVQQARNAYLQRQITQVDGAIQEIRNLEQEKAKLLARMKVIQSLQRSRPEIVHLFEQLVVTIPEGAQLLKVVHNKGALELEGIAESNARVSAFMRNLDRSPWLKNPELVVIDSSTKDYPDSSWFHLRVERADTETEAKEGGQ